MSHVINVVIMLSWFNMGHFKYLWWN